MPAKEPQAPPADNGFSLISNDKLLALYAALLKCRMISRRLGSGHAQREASLAAAVGVAVDLRARDSLAASGTGALARFSKSNLSGGASLRRILSAHSGRGVSPAAALRAAMRKARMNKGEAGQGESNTAIAVAFCEDSCAPAQIWRECLREAALKRLPILFVCCTKDETDHVESLAPKSRFPVVVVDSDDVVAIYRVASEAIAHARRGNGPTLIVCRPWPLVEHHSIHVHDPIVTMERYLARKGLFTPEFKRKTVSGFGRELRTAKNDARI